MIWWTGLAPSEFEFPFPGGLISTFLVVPVVPHRGLDSWIRVYALGVGALLFNDASETRGNLHEKTHLFRRDAQRMWSRADSISEPRLWPFSSFFFEWFTVRTRFVLTNPETHSISHNQFRLIWTLTRL